jgi:D-alanyl-D-alanine carboxypeptidase (penicillin-binding protein 5/6)
MQNADFRGYVSSPTADFPGAGRGDDRETFEIQSTNRLLVGDEGLDPYPGIAGVKNGYTSRAGYTFTGVAERGDRVLLVTCMDPNGEGGDGLEVYRETAALFDWGFRAAGNVEPVGELVPPLSEVDEAEQERGDGHEQEQEHESGGNGEAAPGTADGGQQAPSQGATSPAGNGASVGAGPVLAFTAAGLAVLGAGAYVFHRRHPLPLPRSPRAPRSRRARSRPAHRRGDDPPA